MIFPTMSRVILMNANGEPTMSVRNIICAGSRATPGLEHLMRRWFPNLKQLRNRKFLLLDFVKNNVTLKKLNWSFRWMNQLSDVAAFSVGPDWGNDLCLNYSLWRIWPPFNWLSAVELPTSFARYGNRWRGCLRGNRRNRHQKSFADERLLSKSVRDKRSIHWGRMA